jgi:hypothetical protein
VCERDARDTWGSIASTLGVFGVNWRRKLRLTHRDHGEMGPAALQPGGWAPTLCGTGFGSQPPRVHHRRGDLARIAEDPACLAVSANVLPRALELSPIS